MPLTQYRALLRVTSVTRTVLRIKVVASLVRHAVPFPRSMFPKGVRYRKEFRFYGRACLGAEKAKDLNLTGPFEIPDRQFEDMVADGTIAKHFPWYGAKRTRKEKP